jgi:hypothetical protein
MSWARDWAGSRLCAQEWKNLASWASAGIRLKANKEIGKTFLFLKPFYSLQTHLNSNQI